MLKGKTTAYWCPQCGEEVPEECLSPGYYLVTYPDMYGVKKRNEMGRKEKTPTGFWRIRLVRRHSICEARVWAKKMNGKYSPKAVHP